MFRRDVVQIKDIILKAMREQGLETPLKQKRLVEAWPDVAGPVIARYTLNTYIYNHQSSLACRSLHAAHGTDTAAQRCGG